MSTNRFSKVLRNLLRLCKLYLKYRELHVTMEHSERWLATHDKIKQTVLKIIADGDDTLTDFSILSICTNANINRKTFYTHFKNINYVLKETIQDILGQQTDGNRPYCQFNAKKEDIIHSLQQVKRYRIFFHKIMGYYFKTFEEFLKKNKSEKSHTSYFNHLRIANEEEIISFIFVHSGVISCLKYWIETDFRLSEEEIATIITKFLLHQ